MPDSRLNKSSQHCKGNAIEVDRARKSEKQGERTCRDDGYFRRCVDELGGGNLSCARLPSGGIAFGEGGYWSHAEELSQQRHAQGDEHSKERPDHVQSENDDDAYEGVREAVRLEPGVEHEVREAKIRNSVEAHDDERCLPNVV